MDLDKYEKRKQEKVSQYTVTLPASFVEYLNRLSRDKGFKARTWARDVLLSLQTELQQKYGE
jgi:hypothetical protein